MAAPVMSWLELAVPDLGQALDFYRAVFAWTSQPIAPRAHPHAWLTGNGVCFGGASERDGKEVPPGWAGFVKVDDLDAVLDRARALDATILGDPVALPDLVRFCRVMDPAGQPLGLFEVLGPGPHEPLPQGARDPIGWRQLCSPEPEKVAAFLTALLGWVELGAHEIGPAGPYRLLGPKGGQAHIGLMRAIPGEPLGWLFYFDTPNLDASLAAVTAQGGRVITETMEVPGGAIISHAFDPGMAKFGLIQMPAPPG